MRILFILLVAISINAFAADSTPSTAQDQPNKPQQYVKRAWIQESSQARSKN